MKDAKELTGELPILGPRSKKREDERLLTLYWNRAELKKEFRKLRDQNYALIRKLESKDESRQLLQQRIESLETLLANPEAGFNAIVFFQLRFVWRTCRAELEKFSAQLLSQQLQRARRAQLMRFNQERAGKVELLRGEIQEQRQLLQQAGAERQTLEGEIASLTGFWNHSRRRKRKVRVEELSAAVEGYSSAVEQLIEEKTALEQAQAPETDSTSVAARRLINLAVIALAQQHFDYFDEKGLARLAHEAMIKPIEEIKYGHRADCIRYIEEIPKAIAKMNSDAGLSDVLRQRTAALRSVAQYKSDGDTVPRPESINAVLQHKIATPGVPTVGEPVNVLASDFWDVCAAMTP